MLLRTRLYMMLNPLFGTPRKIAQGSYTHTANVFDKQTEPFLESISGYVPENGRVLIVGCGTGAEIKWFARRADQVVAIDVNPSCLNTARNVSAQFANVECQLVDPESLPFEDNEFDLIFMHNVCEHIIHLESCFKEYRRVLKNGAVLVNDFSPLFYSPYGAHLADALKIPWGHLIFGNRAVIEIRNIFYPGTNTSKSWEELGLNRVTERRYRKVIMATGFADELYTVRTCMNIPFIRWIPLLSNLFVLQITNVLRKT